MRIASRADANQLPVPQSPSPCPPITSPCPRYQGRLIIKHRELPASTVWCCLRVPVSGTWSSLARTTIACPRSPAIACPRSPSVTRNCLSPVTVPGHPFGFHNARELPAQRVRRVTMNCLSPSPALCPSRADAQPIACPPVHVRPKIACPCFTLFYACFKRERNQPAKGCSNRSELPARAAERRSIGLESPGTTRQLTRLRIEIRRILAGIIRTIP